MRRYTLPLLVTFFWAHGLVYVFVTPPWQAPDEPTHLEHVWLFARQGPGGFPFTADPAIQREILATMEAWHFYSYVGVGAPEETPDEFSTTPFLQRSWTQVHRPPVYYAVAGGVIWLAGLSTTLSGMYLARILGLAMGTLTLLLTWFTARRVAPQNSPLPLVATATVALVPQFVAISASVNSDNLANAIAAGILFVGVTTLQRGWTWQRTATLVGLLVLGTFTKRTSLTVVVFLAGLLWFRPPGRRRWLPFVLGGVALAGVYALARVLPPLQPVAFGLEQFGSAVIRIVTGQDTYYLERLSLTRKFLVDGFWLRLGWMRFPATWPWYVGIYLAMMAAVVGLLRKGAGPAVRLLGGFTVGLVLIVVIRFFQKDGAIQGRYLFLAMPAIAIVLAQGWLNLDRRGRLAKATLAYLIVFAVGGGLGTLLRAFSIDGSPPAMAIPRDAQKITMNIGTPEARPLLKREFYADTGPADDPFAWMGWSGAIRLPELTSDANWTVTLRVLPYDIGEENALRIRLADVNLARVDGQTGWQTVTFALPRSLTGSRPLLELHPHKAQTPIDLGRSDDYRFLSYGVAEVTLKRDGPPGPTVTLGGASEPVTAALLLMRMARGHQGVLAQPGFFLGLFVCFGVLAVAVGAMLIGYRVSDANLPEGPQS